MPGVPQQACSKLGVQMLAPGSCDGHRDSIVGEAVRAGFPDAERYPPVLDPVYQVAEQHSAQRVCPQSCTDMGSRLALPLHVGLE